MTLHAAAGTTVHDEHNTYRHKGKNTQKTYRHTVGKEHTIPIGSKSAKNTHAYRYKVRKEHTYL